ncbi:MAG: hypothetical protein J5756_07825 [Clostridia bacterium]|nr:hypothetical protein [Clostridia bacterium]
MGFYDNIIKAVSDYNVTVNTTEDVLTIVNNNGNELTVFMEEYLTQDMKDHFYEYIVRFSTQHRHFEEDEEAAVIEYILSILDDKILPLEFFSGDNPRFGGEIKLDDLNKLSVSYLSNEYGYAGDYLRQFDYEIHSWSGEYDTGRRRVSDLRD